MYILILAAAVVLGLAFLGCIIALVVFLAQRGLEESLTVNLASCPAKEKQHG